MMIEWVEAQGEILFVHIRVFLASPTGSFFYLFYADLSDYVCWDAGVSVVEVGSYHAEPYATEAPLAMAHART